MWQVSVYADNVTLPHAIITWPVQAVPLRDEGASRCITEDSMKTLTNGLILLI